MRSTHAYIAEPTGLATTRPQDGAGVMSVGAALGARGASVVSMTRATSSSKPWTTNSSFAGLSKPLTCDGTLHTRSQVRGAKSEGDSGSGSRENRHRRSETNPSLF